MDPIVTLIMLLILYMLPTLVAGARGHHNSLAIGVINVFFGWTLLGWVIALAWACTAVRYHHAHDHSYAPHTVRTPPPLPPLERR